MDAITLDFTKKKKNSNIAPIAQSKSESNNYTQGKSRLQGNNGVMQGGEGWKSQYQMPQMGGANINTILHSLNSKPTYSAPQIKNKLTTQEGFNEALGAVGNTNRSKLDMQNRRVLQGVLGSLLNNQSQNRSTDARVGMNSANNSQAMEIATMNNATNNRRIDATQEYQKGQL